MYKNEYNIRNCCDAWALNSMRTLRENVVCWWTHNVLSHWREYHLGSSILICNLFYTPSKLGYFFRIFNFLPTLKYWVSLEGFYEGLVEPMIWVLRCDRTYQRAKEGLCFAESKLNLKEYEK